MTSTQVPLPTSNLRCIEWDARGVIIASHSTTYEMFEYLIASGKRYAIHPTAMGETHYLTDPDDAQSITERPTFVAAGGSLAVEVRVETELGVVPAGVVEFSGPVSGRQVHEGGPLSIGFTVPGEYVISFNIWPFLPFTGTISVRRPDR